MSSSWPAMTLDLSPEEVELISTLIDDRAEPAADTLYEKIRDELTRREAQQ